MTVDARLVDSIQVRFPDAILSTEDEWTLTLFPTRLVEVGEFLRDDAEARYDLLVTLTGVADEVHYHLVSLPYRRRLRVRVQDRPAPDSVASVWPAANWAEREARDLWGVRFGRRSSLQPLLRPLVRQGIDGHAAGLAVGARYPASIEGLFIDLKLDGEHVVEARPELGYRHSGLEKQLAAWPYWQGTSLAARMDGFAAMHADLAYALAVERLLGVEPPLRAQWLRVIYAELQRIASHLFWLARCAQNLSGPTLSGPAYAWQGRMSILDFFQWLGGNPITPDTIAVGGLRCDTPPAFVSALRDLLEGLSATLAGLDVLFTRSAAFRSHLEGLGVVDPGSARGLGMTGPCLRACGMDYDVRRTFPYSGYGAFDVQVPVEREGDAWARYRVRMAEMEASLDLIRQAGDRLPQGGAARSVNALAPGQVFPILPPGAAYVGVEGARGELGVYLVSDGSPHLRRAHVRGPSFANLSALPLVTRGLLADRVPAALDSLDISMGEVER
jgi:NADH-quinone oxidoreductase subunit D